MLGGVLKHTGLKSRLSNVMPKQTVKCHEKDEQVVLDDTVVTGCSIHLCKHCWWGKLLDDLLEVWWRSLCIDKLKHTQRLHLAFCNSQLQWEWGDLVCWLSDWCNDTKFLQLLDVILIWDHVVIRHLHSTWMTGQASSYRVMGYSPGHLLVPSKKLENLLSDQQQTRLASHVWC